MTELVFGVEQRKNWKPWLCRMTPSDPELLTFRLISWNE